MLGNGYVDKTCKIQDKGEGNLMATCHELRQAFLHRACIQEPMAFKICCAPHFFILLVVPYT